MDVPEEDQCLAFTSLLKIPLDVLETVPEVHLAATVQLVPSQYASTRCDPPPVMVAPQIFVAESETGFSIPCVPDAQVGKLPNAVGSIRREPIGRPKCMPP